MSWIRADGLAVAFDNPQNYNHQAKRYAESLDNAVWTNQFDNPANRGAHIVTTGPEIWDQTDGGKLDAFICATGTGGTLAGVTRYLTEKSDGRVECWLADPPGSVLYNVVETGKVERVGTGSITEGMSTTSCLLGHTTILSKSSVADTLTRYRTRSSDKQPQTRPTPPYRCYPHSRLEINRHGLSAIARGRTLRRCF